MVASLDGDLKAVFGSRTEMKLLGALADSREPQTGYFLAKKAGLRPSKAYTEFRKLARAGILETSQTASGYRKYLLVDEDLRRFLLRRVRITTTAEWFSVERTRERRDAFERVKRSPVELPDFTPAPERIRNREEFERVPEKDEALERIREARRGEG